MKKKDEPGVNDGKEISSTRQKNRDSNLADLRGLTRRQFLRGVAGATIAGAAGIPLVSGAWADDDTSGSATAGSDSTGKPGAVSEESSKTTASRTKKARVVLVRDPAVLGEGRTVNAKVITRMFDDGVTALTGSASPAEAWAGLIRREDTVGIKSNEWDFLPTPPELEEIISLRVQGAGVPAERIAVDDRGILNNPIFQKATALINVRPLRTHHWSGVGSLIKNYIMFSPAPWDWHDDACADLAGVWKLPPARGKTRLNILVMLTPLFHGKGAHHYQARYTWDYGGLIIGTDPVAVDATGLRILEAKRRDYFGENQPFTVSPKHIRLADERHGLGVADPERIEIIRIGPMEGALV